MADFDKESMSINYTTNNFTVPSQARSEEEFKTIDAIASQA